MVTMFSASRTLCVASNHGVLTDAWVRLSESVIDVFRLFLFSLPFSRRLPRRVRQFDGGM